jgi:ketosteroid isomerase-like protein
MLPKRVSRRSEGEMSGERHLGTVQGIYQAFGSGDVPAILERLAEDVAWEQ